MARHRQAHRGKRRGRDGTLLWQPTERYEGCDRTRDSRLLLRGWRRSAHEIRIPVLVWRKFVPRGQRIRSCACELPKRIFLDLVEANRQQLIAAGVLKKNIETSSLCTNCHPETLFSYRAEKGKTGRMMAVAGIRG